MRLTLFFLAVILLVELTGCTGIKDKGERYSKKALEEATYARCVLPFLTYVRVYDIGEALNTEALRCKEAAGD